MIAMENWCVDPILQNYTYRSSFTRIVWVINSCRIRDIRDISWKKILIKMFLRFLLKYSLPQIINQFIFQILRKWKELNKLNRHSFKDWWRTSADRVKKPPTTFCLPSIGLDDQETMTKSKQLYFLLQQHVPVHTRGVFGNSQLSDTIISKFNLYFSSPN